MNPLTNVKNITKLNERELNLGIDQKNSWHNMYSSSAWVFIGGLNYDLSEGDVITVFSQYGEVVNINLIRDRKTGKSKGFCFLCYEDQRSTVLAVDNLNGIKLVNRIIRVDHVSQYKVPKQHEDMDQVTKQLYSEGCAPKEVLIKDQSEDQTNDKQISKSDKKHRKKRRRRNSWSSDTSSSNSSSSTSSTSSDDKHKSRHKYKRKDKKDDNRSKPKYSSDHKKHFSNRSDKNKFESKKEKNSKHEYIF